MGHLISTQKHYLRRMKNRDVGLYGWVIYPQYTATKKDNAFGWLTKEASHFDIRIDTVFLEELMPVYGQGASCEILWRGVRKEMPDFVVMREYDGVISRHFELAGVPVINSWQSMMLCKNKMLTHQLLASAGIPTPDTVYSPSNSYDYDSLSRRFDNDKFIVKKIDGAKGEGIFLIGNQYELDDAVRGCGGPCICQKYIIESHGRDVRIWVIGDRAVAGVLRYSENSFLSNYSQGGSAASFTITPDVEELCVNSAKLLGLEFSGIDLLFTESGFTVCEINGNAGFRTLSAVGENNIPHELFKYISEKYCFRS